MVMGIFENKCPHCGKAVARNATYCSNCGSPLSGGELLCGACGAKNRPDARFCTSCGRPLAESAAPELQGQRWSRRENDFAVRIDANDLPGLLNKGLIVEPGTNALLVERGETKGLVPPGSYRIENLLQKGWDRIQGEVPRSVTALLVDVTPTELDFHLGGRFTRDPLPIGLSTRVVVEVDDPGKFLVNVLKSRERYSRDNLREFLYPEVVQVADRWLREHTLAELAEDATQRERLEMAIEQSLRRTFQQSGLRFLQTRTIELNLEPYDKINGMRGKYALLDMEASVNLEGRKRQTAGEEESHRFEEELRLRRAHEESGFKKRWSDLQHEQNLLALVEEARKVEQEERRLDLNERMRRAVLADKLNEIRSEKEFETFLDDLDYDKLLKEKERAELLRGWREAGEDHDRARAFMLAKSEVEGDYELRALKSRLQHGANLQAAENEIEIARKRADYEFDLRRRTLEEEIQLENKRIEIQRQREAVEDERQRRRLELARLQRDYDLDTARRTQTQEREEDEADALLGMRLLSQMKEIRRKEEEDSLRIRRLDEEETRRIRRVDDLERKKTEQELLLQRLEVEERIRQGEREHHLKVQQSQQEFELQRLEQLGKFGPEALIAVSGAEQGRILADLKKSEALKGMSEEQILAMAAQNSPEVARAFQEKYRAIAEGKVSQDIREMYDRLVHEKDDSLRRVQEDSDRRARDISTAWEKSSAQAKDSTDRAVDRISDVAQTFARSQPNQGSGQPPIVVVTPGGGSQVIQPSGGASTNAGAQSDKKFCPDCGQSVPVQEKFCSHCGHAFKGV